MDTHSDLHKEGVYAVRTPLREILFDTFAPTAYSARAEFCVRHNRLWSKAAQEGFQLVEFSPTGLVTVAKPTEAEEACIQGLPQTASEWELYASKNGADEAAHVIHRELAQRLREFDITHSTDAERSAFAIQTRDEMLQVMNKYSDFGARDTEPECVLCTVLERYFQLPQGAVPR